MKQIILAIMCLFFLGCENAKLKEVAISSDFDGEYMDVIVKAVDDAFEDIPEAKVKVFIGKHNGKGAIVIAKPDKKPCKEDIADTKITKTKGPKIRLCVDRLKDPRLLRLAVLHEMGHAIRARDGHLLEYGNVMYENVKISLKGYTTKDIEYIKRALIDREKK